MKRGRPRYPDMLTPREREVLELIREGLTNEQIAQRLGISERGARYHVPEILSKLGVGSREEAAAWDGGPQKDRRAAVVLAVLHRTVGGLPAGVVAAATVGLLALALGIVLMSSRGGGPSQSSVSGREDSETLSERVLSLAQEAKQEARALLPGAELEFVAYSTYSGIYTFRFFEPDSRMEVSIVGPYEKDPAFARWETILEERPADSPTPTLLHLSATQNSFEAVAEAAALRSASAAGNMGVILYLDEGELTWGTSARISSGRYTSLIQCNASDAALSLMTCERSTPAPHDLPPGLDD